jgi:hypothetical protein
MGEFNIMAYIDNSFTFFSSWLIASDFSSVLIVLRLFFIWIALGDVDLCFSLILVTNPDVVQGGTTSAV